MSPQPPLATTTTIEGGTIDINEDVCMYFARVVQAVGFTTKTFPPSVPPNVREMYRLLLEVRVKILIFVFLLLFFFFFFVY